MVTNFLIKTRRKLKYDITIFQTPAYGQQTGYKQVYRLYVEGSNHHDAINYVYRIFNINDLMPKDYRARYINTGDILFFDEGRNGHSYYKLCTGGWKKVNRFLIR